MDYLSQLRLTVHHIQGVENKCADYISRNNFDALIGARSEALAKKAFSCMDVHLDLNMTMIRPLDGLQRFEYLKEFGDIYKRVEKRFEPLLVNQDQWKRDKSYLWHEDSIVVPSDRVPALLKWTHESSGHVGADRTLRLFKQWFHTTWTDDQLRKTLQPIVDKCLCRSCKPGDIRDRGLYSTLPIPHCANSVLYVDYTEMPKFGGYDFALVVTCGLTRFTRVFPCTKHITGEETIKILLEEWFCVYGAPKEIKSDEEVRVRSDTGWYKRVLRSLNVQVSTGIPYLHTSNPLYERQIRVLKENVRIWCKTERTRDWVRLLAVISLMTNSQESSATGYSPHELFLGRPAWFLHAPYPEDTHSSVGEWVQEQQAKVDKAKAMLQRVRERQWNKENKHRVPAIYQEGDWVLVHHSRLPAWPRSTSDHPYFRPYKILSVDGHRITVRCSPRLGGTLLCAAQHLVVVCFLGTRLHSCASLFLKIRNPKSQSTNLAGSLDGAPIITQSRRHKPCSKIKVSYSAHSQLAFDASLLFTDCQRDCDCDLQFARCCAAAVRSHNTTPPLRPRRGLTHLGGRHNVEAEQAQKKNFGPRHVLATEA